MYPYLKDSKDAVEAQVFVFLNPWEDKLERSVVTLIDLAALLGGAYGFLFQFGAVITSLFTDKIRA